MDEAWIDEERVCFGVHHATSQQRPARVSAWTAPARVTVMNAEEPKTADSKTPA